METRFRRSSGRRGNKGLYYLQFSGKTENEMRKKLAEQGFSPASVEDTVLFLKHYRYLDDEDYARRYVEKKRPQKEHPPDEI